MRLYIRHPTDVPIDFQIGGQASTSRELLTNYSEGGLCFTSDTKVEAGTEIHIAKSPLHHPNFTPRASWYGAARSGVIT